MLSEKLKRMKEKSKLTLPQISDKSGVPQTTVHRILSGETDNPTFQNVRDIVIAMGGSLDDLADIMHDKVHASDNEKAIKILEKSIESKDKWILRLFIVLVGMIGIFMALVLIDVLHGGIGFVRY